MIVHFEMQREKIPKEVRVVVQKFTFEQKKIHRPKCKVSRSSQSDSDLQLLI